MKAPFTAAFTSAEYAKHLLEEYSIATQFGNYINLSLLDGEELRKREPLVGANFHFGIELEDQALLDPPQFAKNFVSNLQQSGVSIVENCAISKIERNAGKLRVTKGGGQSEIFDAVVIATGAWLNRLAGDHGVKIPVVAGIGYSMSVEVPKQTRGMLIFPESFIACTTYQERLRISSFMQMGDVETPRDPRREQRLLRNAQKILPNLHWESVSEFWSGGRPLTPDGKPVIGKTRTQGVYVNAGHGMWGITLGPISGKVLAELIVGQDNERLLEKFSPLR